MLLKEFIRAVVREEIATSLDHCSACGGPWHPSTGSLVGSPQQYPLCYNCTQDAWKAYRWATNRKARKGKPSYEFYPPPPIIKP